MTRKPKTGKVVYPARYRRFWTGVLMALIAWGAILWWLLYARH